MSTPENSGLPEGLLIASDMPQSQIGSVFGADEPPAEGVALKDTVLPQIDSSLQVSPRRRVAASAFVNQSGAGKPAASADPTQTPRSKGKLEIPVPNMEFLSIDGSLGVQTEFDVARDKFLDLIESMRTGRYLTDKLLGVEKHSNGGEPRAVIFHGDYKVIIMASMLVNLPRDLRDQDPNTVYHYLLTKRIGSEIDYVVKGIDSNSGLAVASRKEAMENKRNFYYLTPTKQGTYRIYEGLCCEARVMSVIPDGIFVDLFGIDTYIPLKELSYTRLSDAMGHFEPGDRILVKVTSLKRDNPDHIRVTASVKQVAANPLDKAIEKIEVGCNYGGTVTMTDSTGIFVKLDMGTECRCRYPYRARPPRGARVIVKIAGVDAGRRLVWGNITYVTIPK